MYLAEVVTPLSMNQQLSTSGSLVFMNVHPLCFVENVAVTLHPLLRMSHCICNIHRTGNPPGCGTVTEKGVPMRGYVTVQWDMGEEHYYRMGFLGCYDLCLADEG